MEVSKYTHKCPLAEICMQFCLRFRPQEHRSFDVLHWIKAAFKKQALDTLTEAECLNKEAFR